jgi:tRNA-2-methylthio-N6-dimethylallyladenosine synthase
MANITDQNIVSNFSAADNLSVFIETYGCQMNEYDTELVRSILSEKGFSESDTLESADVILLNTCSVRESAHNRIYGRLQRLNHLRKIKPRTIGVIGCMAQSLKVDLLDNNIHVDLIAGPDGYRNLPNLISDVRNEKKQAAAIDLSEFETYEDIYPTRKVGVNAWIAIMRGCDNFCTFCVVPYTRGRERSRSLESVVDETRRLVAEGYSQVTLLGQNVNSYEIQDSAGQHTFKFADLIQAVADVPGIRRVRFTSPHPKDFPDPLLDAMKSHPHICKHIHLPLQAGSDRILKMMRRRYGAEQYLALVDKIRNLMPDIVLTTDVILGFPTETRQEFEETVKVMETVQFDSAFIFNYSERKGTVAKRRWKDDILPEEKKYRITALNDIQRKISLEQNKRHIGEIHEILVEGTSKRESRDWSGRTDGNKMVVFPRTDQNPGQYIKVKIHSASANTLKGDVV